MKSQVLSLPVRRRRAVATPLFPAEIRLYPLTRYAGSVDRLARHLRSFPTQEQRNEAMIAHIDREWRRLTGLGATDALCEREVVAFARAVWLKVASGFQYGGAA